MSAFFKLFSLAVIILLLAAGLFLGVVYAITVLFNIALFSPENFAFAFWVTLGILAIPTIALVVLKKMWNDSRVHIR